MKIKDAFQINPGGSIRQFDRFINYIDTSSVIAGRLTDVQYLTSDYPSRAKRVLKIDDILYSSVRPNLKHYYHYNFAIEHPVASTGFVVLRNKRRENIDTRFCFYFLTQSHIVDYLDNIAQTSQTTFPTFSYKDLGRIFLPSISIDKQRKITSILSAYDDLIENNNKRIKILEQMAANLYKEWFVRFRFPGYENAEFENGIPKGWKINKLSEIFIVKYGKDHKALQKGNIPIFGSGGIIRYGDRILYSGETILIPRKGTLNNLIYYNGDLWTVDTMFYTKFIIPHCTNYIYFVLSRYDMGLLNTGASIPSMSADVIYHLKILIPPQEFLERFDKMMNLIRIQQKNIELMNQNLTKQRDMLLPRLMSGKLEV